ncbi:hypothetical protein ACFT38_27830 [Streptomyces sp. NPDC056975]|uniref:hypothetical protein n=1 Tax=Streptomyces sp. NPDC056975 TaxID=3345985 RepID=UPI003627E31C
MPQADHVTVWDNLSESERAERLARALAAQAAIEARQRALDTRVTQAAAERAELAQRWMLHRWAQEPETAHPAYSEEQARRQAQQPRTRAEADQSHAADLAKARAEKRARRKGGQQ